jgi:hypothetical protein
MGILKVWQLWCVNGLSGGFSTVTGLKWNLNGETRWLVSELIFLLSRHFAGKYLFFINSVQNYDIYSEE